MWLPIACLHYDTSTSRPSMITSSIELDRAADYIFAPGDTLSGHVALKVTGNSGVSAIELVLQGQLEFNGKKSIIFQRSQDLVHLQWHNVGSHDVPFALDFAKNLPPTVSAKGPGSQQFRFSYRLSSCIIPKGFFPKHSHDDIPINFSPHWPDRPEPVHVAATEHGMSLQAEFPGQGLISAPAAFGIGATLKCDEQLTITNVQLNLLKETSWTCDVHDTLNLAETAVDLSGTEIDLGPVIGQLENTIFSVPGFTYPSPTIKRQLGLELRVVTDKGPIAVICRCPHIDIPASIRPSPSRSPSRSPRLLPLRSRDLLPRRSSRS